MATQAVEVAVLIVSYNGWEDLRECLASVAASADRNPLIHIVVVDNASQDGTVDRLTSEFPKVDCVVSEQNLGFAGGNNLGWKYIQQHCPSVSYVFLLNQDTIVGDGWLRPLVEYLEEHPQVGCVQPKLLLHPETDRINTTGNRSHYLGFGFMTNYGEADDGRFNEPQSIDQSSGAALLVRADLLRRVGLFESAFFMYLEDTELAWKLRQIGYDIVYVPGSSVYHKYSFHADYRYYYYLERNRWWLLLVYYHPATLLLLSPPLLLMEMGQLLFAVRQGRLRDKLRSWTYFLHPTNIRTIWHLRRAAQSRRTVGDRPFMGRFSGHIDFTALDGFLVRWIANPILGTYWSLARRIIFW